MYVPPPLTYRVPLVLGLLLNRETSVPFLPSRAGRLLGGPLLGGGVLLVVWFALSLRRAGTPLIGEPLVRAKPVSTLVTGGPFRYSRNPAYLASTMICVGLASLANALWAILLLPAALFVMQCSIIEREERYLERTFGEEYLRYKL
jgi:protein-S-isoprenylcysteine O-methyltransferase Ste14